MDLYPYKVRGKTQRKAINLSKYNIYMTGKRYRHTHTHRLN